MWSAKIGTPKISVDLFVAEISEMRCSQCVDTWISSHAPCRRRCVQQPCCIVMPACTVLLFDFNRFIDLYCHMLIPTRVTLEFMSNRSREGF